MSVKKSLKHLFHPRRSNNHRSKLLHPEYLFGLLGTTIAFFIVTYAISFSDTELGHILGYASDITTDKVIQYTNQERAKSGLQQVSYNPVLSDAARRKAADMFSAQYWAHTSPSGKEPWDFMREVRYTYKVAGENLARDFLDTPSMVAAWMNSPTHRANIMNPRYSEIGVAVVNGTLLGTETTLVVQMFGDPVIATAEVPEPTTSPVAVAQNQNPSAEIAGTQNVEETRDATRAEEAPVADDFVALEFQEEPSVADGPVQVLSTIVVPGGEISVGPMIAPNNLWKAFGIAVALLLLFTLTYDGLIAHNRRIARIVGKNLAHLALFLIVLYVLIFFRGGVIS
ncbi:hypothetical protein KC721_03045 [Candidatus Woesebacteria bacterium]|nr:hypothetical protein [Candidatus Woesebacteria bacterium]